MLVIQNFKGFEKVFYMNSELLLFLWALWKEMRSRSLDEVDPRLKYKFFDKNMPNVH